MRFLTALLASALLAAPALAEDPEPDSSSMRLIRRTEELRGLKFDKNPTVKYWNVDELKKMLRKDFDDEMPEAKAKDVQDVLFAFGLTPKDYDLRKEFLELMLEQIAGFYHPKTKMLCLIQGKSGQGMEEETVIVHELNHAMQDQHYDLTRLQDLVMKNDDMSQAFKCLVEGEATMIMFDNILQQQGGMTSDQVPGIEGIIEAQMKAAGGLQGADKLAKAPPVIRENLVGSYIDGFKFCVAIRRAGKKDEGEEDEGDRKTDKGWKKLNAVWSDLPVSMEQVLHPDRYLKRDMPQKVTMPEKFEALQGWSKVEENTMGEFNTRIVFQTLKPKSVESGQRAADGWDGDAFRLYRKDGKTLLMWVTAWDTDTDAKEFAVAYLKAIRKKFDGLDDVKADGGSFSNASSGGWVAMSVDGKNVFLVEGGEQAEAEAVLAALKSDTAFVQMEPGFGAKK